ncbi:MAG TPA: hypothetical protein VLA62_04380, partial [Solirubrobacterales bacterium]|nr:hypothetical protein [Solirubrobacterales bacterium]
MEVLVIASKRVGVSEGTGGGGRRSGRLAVLVLASLILGWAPAASAQVLVLPNVYLRHCTAGPPFGSTANEAAMERLFGVVD